MTELTKQIIKQFRFLVSLLTDTGFYGQSGANTIEGKSELYLITTIFYKLFNV